MKPSLSLGPCKAPLRSSEGERFTEPKSKESRSDTTRSTTDKIRILDSAFIRQDLLKNAVGFSPSMVWLQVIEILIHKEYFPFLYST